MQTLLDESRRSDGEMGEKICIIFREKKSSESILRYIKEAKI